MSSSTDTLLACSITPAGFRMTDYELTESAILDDKDGRTGRDVKVKVYGEVAADDAATFATNLRLFLAALRSRDGLDFIIVGHGQEEVRLSAATVVDGGPWVEGISIDKQDDQGVLLKKVSFTVHGKQDRDNPDDPSNSGAPTGVKVTTTTRADGTRQVSYSGKFSGASATSRLTAYAAARRQAYAATKWLESRQTNSTFSDTQIEFTLGYAELARPLPLVVGGFELVDVEHNRRVERDEKYRKVITDDYDVLIQPTGDPQSVVDTFRQEFLKSFPAPAPKILRESYSYTVQHEVRVRFSFTVLQGADGSDLLDWEQELDYDNVLVENVQPAKAFEFVGRDPIIVIGAIAARKYVQSGRAVGVNRWPQPPAPLLGQLNLAEQPQVKIRMLNAVERETVWSYTWVFARTRPVQPTELARLERPSTQQLRWLDNPLNEGGA